MTLVRPAELSDLPGLWEHLRRHGLESGRGGDFIYSPHEEPWDRPLEALREEKEERWQRPVTEMGWERCWLVVDDGKVVGELKLAHAIGLKTTLHRAILMMGIERSHRGRGLGKLLIEEALGWARAQPSLAWVQLNVFAHNEPARKLYKSCGFQEVGIQRDLFRVHGQSIDDIELTLRVEKP